MKTYTNPTYEYRRAPELDGTTRHCQVVVVGAGPVGLVAAIDLAQRGIPVLVLDDDDTVSVGSRAICYSKRTLEILDRLGCGEPVASKGVGWSVGKVYQGSELAYQFDLLPERGHHRPAFVNLQQYHFEECLVTRAQALPSLEIRWRHKVSGVAPDADRVTLRVATDDGDYGLTCDWLLVCDGARSPVRHMLGLDFEGQAFRDRFLIADIHMRSDFPAERRFWFDPPFHPNQSVLLHRQSDDVWRVDFQLGWDADPELEKQPERILPRLRAMLGPDAQFEIEWASVYTFQCRRMQKFRHGRLLFAGDAAHLVSPFGARGANGGVQDADNLVWKLDLVSARLGAFGPARYLRCRAGGGGRREHPELHARDRFHHAEKRGLAHVSRCGALARAALSRSPAALVNSGRLSVPKVLSQSPLNTPDGAAFAGSMVPGTVAADAPVRGPRGEWLLDHLGGGFALLVFGETVDAAQARELARWPIPCRIVQVGGGERSDRMVIQDREGLVAARYDGTPGTCYLFRPDQHVCARWRAFAADAVRDAIARATGQ